MFDPIVIELATKSATALWDSTEPDPSPWN
jgi:hypothetical protein